jgi:thioredoxin-related protein
MIVGFASCSWPGSKTDEASTRGGLVAGGIPPQMRARSEASGTPVTTGPPTAEQVAKITPDEEIVFTDPDNPDAGIPELSAVLDAAAVRRGPWEQSESVARRRAMREGKPLLIWFTDSQSSPMCKALSQELFSTPAFDEWAGDKLVRLKVDVNGGVDDVSLSLDEKQTRLIEIERHAKELKKRFKVLGHPTVLMVNNLGEVIGRYRGYQRGEADYFWGLIRQGEAVFTNAYGPWRAGMERKGYREWSDRRGRKVFARLVRYDKGSLDLVEPDGTRSRTREERLSDQDREWIADQKKQRGM